MSASPDAAVTLAESLTEEALLLRLRSTERDFVERKPRGAKGDWLQTAVAFANSVPIGWPAVLFVGVDDNGNPQQGPEKLEDLAKSVSDVLEQCYPPIYRHVVPLHLDTTGACLAVVIPGSQSRPHFAGKSYVRLGPQNTPASDEQFQKLIAERSSVTYEIRKHIGEKVTLVVRDPREHVQTHRSVELIECNLHWVILKLAAPVIQVSYPTSRLELSWNPGVGLQVEVRL